jgi:hypothetical protein
LSLINNIHDTSKPIEDISIKFYTSSLLVSIVVFVKRVDKRTLEDTIRESINVEKDMIILKGNLGLNSDQNTSSNTNKELPQQIPLRKSTKIQWMWKACRG